MRCLPAPCCGGSHTSAGTVDVKPPVQLRDKPSGSGCNLKTEECEAEGARREDLKLKGRT